MLPRPPRPPLFPYTTLFRSAPAPPGSRPRPARDCLPRWRAWPPPAAAMLAIWASNHALAEGDFPAAQEQIGRASCRERVEVGGGAVAFKRRAGREKEACRSVDGCGRARPELE